jgi:ATP-dependent Clp protease ATP-binding subunit ClpC
MANIKTGTHWLLNKRGITESAVIDSLAAPTATGSVTSASSKSQLPLYHRSDLQNKLINLLSIATNRHVILVGPAGVGKRSLVLSLAQLMVEGKGPVGLKSVVELDERALLDDAVAAVQAALRKAKGGILFVPDIDRFFGGIRADFREEAGNALQKAFISDEVVIIGTANQENYNKKLKSARVINEHSQILTIPPTTVAETLEILKILRPKFERDYNLSIVEASLSEVARLAERYYTSEPLPGAAVHLLHQACALIKTSSHRTEEVKVKEDNQLDPEDVLVATSMLTGIPVTNMGADERDRYLTMVDHLHKRIIGQNEAVLALSRTVKMARVGLKDPKRPIGSFLFLGPTGVGKTELAKALAEFMFGTEDALITLDMSEYMDDSSVNRLIGSPPGYVGHEAGGQLTDAVKQQPYSVVLFDEVEKASVKVFDVLLQVLDAGRLTSGQGETVSFSECVILMTSNIGSRYLADPNLSETVAREEAEVELKAHFRPEFLNRLDDIIFFDLLTAENLRDILDLLLRQEEKLAANRGLTLEITPPAKSWLLAQNDHPEWGARPLRRIIQKHIREPLADFLLTKNPPPGTKVKVRVKDKALLFET